MAQRDGTEATLPPIYLHCGYHKTATTYFQHILRLNAEALRPVLGVVNRVTFETDAARAACQAYLDLPQPGPEDRAALVDTLRGLNDFEALRRSEVPVLISDEAFIGHHPGQKAAGGRLYPRAPEIAAALVEALAPRPVHILLMRRDEGAWLRSVHNQGVKNDGLGLGLEALRRKMTDPLDLAAVTRAVAAHVPAAEVHDLRLEEDRAHWFGAGGTILDLVGVPRDVMETLERPKRRNESMAPWALAIMQVTNRLSLPDGINQWIRHVLLSHQLRLGRWDRRRKALEGQPGIVPR